MTRTFLLTAVALFAIGATAADAAMMAYKEGGTTCAVQDESGAKAAPRDQGAAAADVATTAHKDGGAAQVQVQAGRKVGWDRARRLAKGIE
jgi:hypothetical protein